MDSVRDERRPLAVLLWPLFAAAWDNQVVGWLGGGSLDGGQGK
jgi:hypothetical protein